MSEGRNPGRGAGEERDAARARDPVRAPGGQGPRHEHDGDDDLRAWFDALRAEDRARAPAFDALLQNARAAGPRRRWLRLAVPLAAAAGLAALLIARTPDSADAVFREAVVAWSTDPALGAWRSPTDFLLDVPGSDLLRTTPRLRVGVEPGAAGNATGGVNDDTTKGGAP